MCLTFTSRRGWHSKREVAFKEGGSIQRGRWHSKEEVAFKEGGGIQRGRWHSKKEVAFKEGGDIQRVVFMWESSKWVGQYTTSIKLTF